MTLSLKIFVKNEFGKLTAITNPKTGVTMFVANEVATMWGHTNIRQAVNRLLNKSEYKVIKLSKYPDFKDLLLCNRMLQSSKAPSITLLTESAIYKMALSSNLEKAKPFRDWVTSEVLPSIRKRGYYTVADQTQAMMIHTDTSIQKQNSKNINKKNFILAGVEAIIEYNRNNCLLHTKQTPSELIQYGKSIGLNSKQTSSGKEVLRNIDPGMACCLSLTDNLTTAGFDLKTASDLSLKVLSFFNGMIEIGGRPSELNQ